MLYFRNGYRKVDKCRFPSTANIVNFLGVTGEENHPALVTQLCSLGPADELLSETHEKSRRASLSLQTIVHIALQAAQGLHHLHNCGIIHHDVAARNVLLEGTFSSISEVVLQFY